MDLMGSYTAAQQQRPPAELAGLAYITTERAASGETPALLDFVTAWMKDRNYFAGLACLDLLIEKKCNPNGPKEARVRQDKETPSIIHELSQAIYTISLVEAGYELPDVEALLCMNFTHDLGEEFDVTKIDFKQNLYDHGIPHTDRTDFLAERFENMTKSRSGVYKYNNNQDYFLTMLDDPTTVIAKFQDRIHNMATLIGVKKLDKHKAYITETIELRDTLNQAKILYPLYAPVFDIMDKIVTAQIHFNVGFLNRISPEDPVNFSHGIIPRLSRIAQLPAGLDPLHITQTRSNNTLVWRASRISPEQPLSL